MIGKTGANAEELRRHLHALDAATALLDRRPEEAAASARRVAKALARLGERSGRGRLAAAARRLRVAPEAAFPSALQELTACLREAVEVATAPRGTVLIVEDDPLPAKLLGHALAQKGWEVEVAGTAELAENVLAARSVSAVVLDLVLPDADGRNLLLRLKESPRSAAIPVYVASARSDPHVQAECLALGAEAFLPKPVEPESLLRLIAERASAPQGADQHEPATSAIASRSALINAFESNSGGVRSLALVAVAQTTADEAGAPEPLRGDALAQAARVIAESIDKQAVVARWAADEVAVVFPGVATVDAARGLDAARKKLQALESGLDFVAGLVDVEPDSELDEAIDQAGRLRYLASGALGGGVLVDPDQAGPPDITILVAEDDEVAAKLLVYRLSREPGFTIVHCSDGHDALMKAQEISIDLAILDVNMPGIDGFDLLARLRKMPRYARLPIAMLTSLGSEKDVVRGLDLGADDYVVKPFSPTELLARVRRLLGRAAARS